MNSIQQKLCTKLAQTLGVRNVILFSSCRNALYTLLCSLHLKKDDEVVIQSFICDSLTLAIRKAGATPRLVDVDSRTLNLEVAQVTEAVNERTKAVIFVHTYGNPSGIKEMSDFCRERKIVLIEDIAHALGARYNGCLAGTFGDYVVYSFTKQMVNIGGGALLTNHDVKSIIALQQRQKGKAPWIDYAKRLIGSFYETRAFFLSKLIIDFVRKRTNLKLAQELSPHSSCSWLESLLALYQIDSVFQKIFLRKQNYDFLKKQGCEGQQFHSAMAFPAYSYLSSQFSEKRERDEAVRRLFLSLPPWPGSSVSDMVLFIPNRPRFSKRKLRKIAKVCTARKY